MTKFKNIFNGDLVEVKSTSTIKGMQVVNYTKAGNRQKDRMGMDIREHTKPQYVFEATYKAV